MGYSIKAVQGFSWHSLFKFSSIILTAIKLIILARILNPLDFGLFSLVSIALGLMEAATQTGVNFIILRSKRSLEYFLDTAWVIAIIRGLLISILMVILALLMSNFYQESSLLPLITLASFVPLIKGFINPSIVKMQKELHFFQDSLYRLSLIFVEVFFAIILGILLKSVYALIIAMLISAIFEVVISFIFFKQRPIFHYNPTRAQEIFSQSKWLNLSAILSYLHENLDNLIIGKFTSTTNLGYYQNAYALSHKLNHDLSASVAHSTTPIFSQIADDNRRLKRAFYRSTIVSLFTFILLSIPLIIYPKIIVIILGSKWQDSIALIRPLTLAGIVQSFSSLCYIYFYVRKNFKVVNSHLLISVVSMVLAIMYLTPRYGVVAAAWGIFFSRLISVSVIAYQLWKK